MSGPFGSSQWMYSSGGFYPDEIEQSLRFNDDDSAFLERNFPTATNRTTWTWSAWIKRGNIAGSNQDLFSCSTANDNGTFIRIRSDETFQILHTNTGTITFTYRSSDVLRDTSAWYHLVVAYDSTDATASDRIKMYINSRRVTSFNNQVNPTLNENSDMNRSVPHQIGGSRKLDYFDGYMAEVNFIDGQALDPTSFGEFKSGVWVANEYTGSYGTNGFYLPFKQTTVANGFNTVLYTGNGSTQSIEGVGFSPDLVWIKERGDVADHKLYDTIRGATKVLESSQTGAEGTDTNGLTAFNADGFTLGSSGTNNGSGDTYVAWAWDAGSGSPVSNTDGSITSSVKANTAYGFSVVSYAGNSTSGATIGHGLSSAPDMIIVKNRTDGTQNWRVQHSSLGPTQGLSLNATDAAAAAVYWDNTAPTSSVFSVDGSAKVNASGDNYIAYCFAEISGYSSFGSYSGTGSSGNTVTTGFKPAFVMIKRTDSANSWTMQDDVRDTDNPVDRYLLADDSGAEGTSGLSLDFLSNGFQLRTTSGAVNASGGTYIYMAFADTRDAAFWRDLSGNDNTWQPNALQNSDVMLDSPTNNFAVWNPLSNNTGGSLSEGNLRVSTGSSQYGPAPSTFAQSSGKWYTEFAATSTSGDTRIGAVRTDVALSTTYDLGNSGSFAYRQNDGQKKIDGSQSSYGATWAASDIIGMALDLDNSEVTFYKNNVSQGTFSITAGEYFIALSDGDSGAGGNYLINFGQDSSFAGNKTAQGNTDDNGVGDFYYAPPSGYLALCTANLPDPVIDPAQDDVPADYFNTVLYTGDAVQDRTISGVNFQPDWSWIKDRSGANTHVLIDAVRGGDKQLFSNLTNAEQTNIDITNGFASDGFIVGDNITGTGSTNLSGNTYVAWNWLAGNGTSSNTDGSITSTVSVNQKAGFSVVGWTGTGSAATVGHGLGVAPAMVIVKNRDDADNWWVYHEGYGATKYTSLNLTDAAQTNSIAWNNTAPTSSVFSIGTSNRVNGSGDAMIAYCFAEVEGYSKFGSYTGNGSTDGPMIWTGFRPAFVMIKRTDASGQNWFIHDTARDTYNDVTGYLYPNTSGAEVTGGGNDILSNGFKLRTSGVTTNTSGGTYIFMAFAELPFKYSLGR